MTAQESKGSGAGPLPGGTAAGRGNTWVVTYKAADEAGAGGRHRERPGERERVSGRQENSAGESSEVGNRERGREASGVAENSGGDREGVGGGVELPRGIGTPGVEEFPLGDETSEVTPAGE